MRIKERTLADYGIKDEKAILKRCEGASEDERMELYKCCMMANSDIGDHLYYSLRYGISYEKLESHTYIPINKYSFYAYRREAMFIFINMLGAE